MAFVSEIFLVSRVNKNNVQILVHKENGFEQVINSRKFSIPKSYTELLSVAQDRLEWLPLFAYDKNRSTILIIDPFNYRKLNGTWTVDVKYSFLRRNGSLMKSGKFFSVPFYGDQVFGIDDSGKALFVRFEADESFRVWNGQGSEMKRYGDLPQSLRSLVSDKEVSNIIPKWPGWSLSEIEYRGELLPQNERWRSTVWSSPPRSPSDLRTSISDVWGSAISWFPKKFYFAIGASGAEGALAQKMYLIQACKFPMALGCAMKSIGPSDVRFDFSQLIDSDLYRINTSLHLEKKLCKGVLGIQI